VSEAAIEARALVREFRKGPRAVDGIDLGVATGEIYGFLGPNGAGKSTTTLMLTTLLPPTSGTARVGGHDIVTEGPAVRAAIGAALQEAALEGGRPCRLPVFLVLFLTPVYVPLPLLAGWVHAVASVNPATALLEAGRGFIAGDPVHAALAFACGAALGVLFSVWALRGLRSAETAG
jgi:hypothetical protein